MEIGPDFDTRKIPLGEKDTKQKACILQDEKKPHIESIHAHYGEIQKEKTYKKWVQEEKNTYLPSNQSSPGFSSKGQTEKNERDNILYAIKNKTNVADDPIRPLYLWSSFGDYSSKPSTNSCTQSLCVWHTSNPDNDSIRTSTNQSSSCSWNASSNRKMFEYQARNTFPKIEDSLAKGKKVEVFQKEVSYAKEEENKSLRKILVAVVAFQRWRQYQLKRVFSKHLKKIKEEYKIENECLKRVQSNDMRIASTSNLDASLLHNPQNVKLQIDESITENDQIIIKNLQHETKKALEKASSIEVELHNCDMEVQWLREHLPSNIKEKSALSKMTNDQPTIVFNQISLLDSKGEFEGTMGQAAQEKDVDLVIYDLQINFDAQLTKVNKEKHILEMELASLRSQWHNLKNEREFFVSQLHIAVEQADLGSRHAQELRLKLDYTTQGQITSAEQLTYDMINNLKKLTNRVIELEHLVMQTNPLDDAQQKHVGSLKHDAELQNNMGESMIKEFQGLNKVYLGKDQLSHAIQIHEDQVLGFMRQQIIPHGSSEPNKHARFGYKVEKTSTDSQSQVEDIPWSSEINPQVEQELWKPCYMPGKLRAIHDKNKEWGNWKRWIIWKWKWALAATKARQALKQMQSWEVLKAHLHKEGKRKQVPRQRHELKDSSYNHVTIQDQNTQALIISTWNAFMNKIRLDPNNIYLRRTMLDKLMASVPWWLRRIAERRRLERYFLHWRRITRKILKKKPYSFENKQLMQTIKVEPSSGVAKDPYIPYYVKVGNAEALVSLRHMRGPYQILKVYQKEVPPNQLHLGKLPGMQITPKLGREAQILYGPSRTPRSDVISTHGICPTFTARALRVLQMSLQQQLDELQTLLHNEMKALQNHVRVEEAMSSYTGGKNEWQIFRGSVDRRGCIKKYLSSLWQVSNILDLALGDAKRHLASNIGRKIDRSNLRISFPSAFISSYKNGWKKQAGIQNCETHFSRSHGLRLEPKSAEIRACNTCSEWSESGLPISRCCVSGNYATLLKAELSNINQKKHASSIEVSDRSLAPKKLLLNGLESRRPQWSN